MCLSKNKKHIITRRKKNKLYIFEKIFLYNTYPYVNFAETTETIA